MFPAHCTINAGLRALLYSGHHAVAMPHTHHTYNHVLLATHAPTL